MNKDNITLKDIARLAGVSTATVSLALAGDPRVNLKTRKRVEDIAASLNYVPNEIGRSLRAKRAETVALIFPNTPHNAFGHPYFVELLEGVTEVLIQSGYHLMLSVSPSETEEEASYNKIVRNRRADGIILWPASIKDRNILQIIDSGFPLVYLGKWHQDDVMTVERDDIGGAYAATEHLIKLGRRRIVHISGPLDYQVSIDRFEGYKKALQDYGLPYVPELLIESDFTKEGGIHAVRRLTQKAVQFDAVFAANDRMAIGAMRELRNGGRSIPGDVAVVGCDNIELGGEIEPSLTTVYQPMREIGRQAADKIAAALSGQTIDPLQSVLPSTLIVRESCGAGAET